MKLPLFVAALALLAALDAQGGTRPAAAGTARPPAIRAMAARTIILPVASLAGSDAM